MKDKHIYFFLISACFYVLTGCRIPSENANQSTIEKQLTAKEILGNPTYQAIASGGYRQNTRDIQPTIDQLKEDMLILSAMKINLVRTYNVHFPHAENVLKAIRELKTQNPDFEMYVMLGAWIDCKNAWTGLEPDHTQESERNAVEIEKAVALANEYADIVKIIAVGNEAMVKWAAAYYVQPWIILKWVSHLQELKKKGELSKETSITSSDNFASWGGGSADYHVVELNQLIKAVDYISMHTYPMHDTHYNPEFWGITKADTTLSKEVNIDKAMHWSLAYAQAQYASVKAYMESLGVNKPVHIGETGWASHDNDLYGAEGSKATDEYKQGIYYQLMREWTNRENITCFYFEAFDEPWKDAANPKGSENYFGLFTVDGQAKYPVWLLVDQGVFEGLSRDGNPINKTHEGDVNKLLNLSPLPPIKTE
jgi:exo-beta-1,3-glucanase (GH17 family)